MHKIKIRGFFLPLFITIISVIVVTLTGLFPVASFTIELPLLVIGLLTAFLLFNFVAYSKATANQIVILSIINLLLFMIVAGISLLVLHFTGLNKISSYTSLNLSPVFVLVGLLTSIIVIQRLIKFEEKKIIKPEIQKPQITENEVIKIDEKCETQSIKEILSQPKIDIVETNSSELSHENQVIAPEQLVAPVENVEMEQQNPQIEVQPAIKPIECPESIILETDPVNNEIFLESTTNTVDNTQNIQSDIELNQEQGSEIFFEEFLGASADSSYQSENQISQGIDTSIKTKGQYSNDIFDESLGELPQITLEEFGVVQKKPEDTKDYNNYIPESVRLVENKIPKKAEGGARIASIGKLLASQKDIENIIEMNELVQQVENDADGSNIITKMLGDKLKETLVQIESTCPQIKNSTITNKAGFSIASLIDDDYRAQTVSALTSGAFAAIQNYVSRINLIPAKIFFETDSSSHMLFKVDNFIFYFTSSRETESINYNNLDNLINKVSISSQDLLDLNNEEGIKQATIADINGNLVTTLKDTEDSNKIAAVSTAIFENLKVFITNIEQTKLDKIIIFTDDQVLTIKKFQDNIVAFLSSVDNPVVLSSELKKVEELIN